MRLLLALVAVLAVPAVASAVIVPQKSIMGVELAMTKAQVKAEAGEPDHVTHPRNEIVGRYTEYQYGRTQVGIADQSGVFYVFTKDKQEKTPGGVGVGVTKGKLRSTLKGEKCEKEGSFHHCFLGRFEAGRTVTDFRIRKGIVRSVTLGTVID
jgi:hypothetical protein